MPILVVEDDPESRLMLATALELDGHQVVATGSGVEALTLARRHQPCLIILDLMMPGMSGQDFRRAQLADPEVAHVPVLVVSAHPDAQRIAREMGAIGAFTKPFDLEALSFCVTARCGSR